MIKNIIFDLGGVVITIDQPQAVRRFTELGLKDATQRLDPYTQEGIFGDLEAGKITAEEFRQEFSKLIGREATYEECQYGWQGYKKDVPQRNLQMLRKLRKEGYRIILLSNTNQYMMDWAESTAFDGEGHPVGDYFDAVYLSFRVKMMKPDEQFFNYVLMQEQILPEETIFIDDGPRNVAAASQLGINTLCPVNGEDWTGDLEEMLKSESGCC
jgi:putative hydrolase of the HAD superfamily